MGYKFTRFFSWAINFTIYYNFANWLRKSLTFRHSSKEWTKTGLICKYFICECSYCNRQVSINATCRFRTISQNCFVLISVRYTSYLASVYQLPAAIQTTEPSKHNCQGSHKCLASCKGHAALMHYLQRESTCNFLTPAPWLFVWDVTLRSQTPLRPYWNSRQSLLTLSAPGTS